jgi:hypothetical protein
VLTANRDLFASRYGANVAVAGEYAGALSNSGETVRLVDARGDAIAELTFDDDSPWPDAADGSGRSLELVQPMSNLATPASWRASSTVGGSPGTGLAALPAAADFNLNGVVDGNDFLAWQRGLGRAGTYAHQADGNADIDADVDSADLGVWQSQFAGSASAATSAAVSGEGVWAAALRGDHQSADRSPRVSAAELVDAALTAMLADDGANRFGGRIGLAIARMPPHSVANPAGDNISRFLARHRDHNTAPPRGGRSILTSAACDVRSVDSTATPPSPSSRRIVLSEAKSAGNDTDCDSF